MTAILKARIANIVDTVAATTSMKNVSQSPASADIHEEITSATAKPLKHNDHTYRDKRGRRITRRSISSSAAIDAAYSVPMPRRMRLRQRRRAIEMSSEMLACIAALHGGCNAR